MTKENGDGMGMSEEVCIMSMVLTCRSFTDDNIFTQETRVHVPNVTSENGYLVLKKKKATYKNKKISLLDSTSSLHRRYHRVN